VINIPKSHIFFSIHLITIYKIKLGYCVFLFFIFFCKDVAQVSLVFIDTHF
jgi:hypothetical protein